MRRFFPVLALASIVAASCASTPPAPAATPLLATSILPSTSPPTVSSAAPPAALIPTTPPIQGITSSRLNVRADPSSASAPVGMIEPFTTVLIRARDPSGNWYQIEYAQGKDGLGWVTAQYVNLQSQAAVPIVAPSAGLGPSGVITQQINVRSAPGTDSNSLGTLNARDVVVLVGRDSAGLWLQILYPAGPEGKAWVAAGYVQADGLDQLPIIGQAGQLIGTPTPTGIPPTAVPTPGIAIEDHDSATAPAADVTFSPAGTGSLIFSSDLSAPAGDSEDWIRFTPYESAVSLRLDCQGATALLLDLTRAGIAEKGHDLPACGATRVLKLVARQPYLLSLSLDAQQPLQAYVRFTISIASLP